MKIQWPWTRISQRVERLADNPTSDLEVIKDALEEARVVNFIKVVAYKKGMSLKYDVPKPISLEDLLQRIEALEADKCQK